jgi:hypothetical protein
MMIAMNVVTGIGTAILVVSLLEWFFVKGATISLSANGSGIAEGRELKAQTFNLAQMPNRITNDCLTENALLLAIPC